MAGNSAESGRSTASRVFAVFDAFDAGHVELTLSEIARRSGLPKSTAKRLLREALGWKGVELTPAGRYRIGIRLWEIGLLADAQWRLRDVAVPFMEDLHRATGENVQLAILDGHDALVIEHIHGSDSVAILSGTGHRLPLHATAVGKVLAAHDSGVSSLLTSAPAQRFTSTTVVAPSRLRSNLARVRRNGIAYVFGEYTREAVSVAAPIFDTDGGVRAAVSLVMARDAGSPYRFASTIRVAAAGIGRSIGADPAG